MRWQAVAPLGLALVATSAWAQPQPPEDSGTEQPVPEPPKESQPPPEEEVKPLTSPIKVTAPDSDPRPEPVVVATPKPPKVDGEGFRFGSYGRAIAGTDLRGGKPEKLRIVARAPRIVEASYLELDLSYGFVRPRTHNDYLVLRPIITIAFDGTLFHDTGQFDAQPAIRNMFLDGRVAKNITAWVGSRMYRGDDIYLFDYWPLDDQNLVGAGGRVAHPITEHDEISIAAAVGFNRLNHPFQFQQVSVPNPVQGATTVEQLNRQRIVGSATAQYMMLPAEDGGIGTKFKLHTEVHALPSGRRERADGTIESLPADSGFLIGGQVGAFGMAPKDSGYRRHLNLYARYAKGLAAFDELAPPTSFGPELKTSRASEVQLGLSGNFDHELGQLMVGAVSRRFIDADTTSTDPDDGWEYAIGARPLARIWPEWFVGADISYQARFPRGLNPITLRADDPALFQVAPMVVFSPMGPSAYDRPQIRLVYRVARFNDAALDLYVPDDPRHDHATVHFLGVQGEWWFNSNTYK